MTDYRTDWDILNAANELARAFYKRRGYAVPEGYRFDQATHPHEVEAWDMAALAFEVLQGTDVEDVLSNLEPA